MTLLGSILGIFIAVGLSKMEGSDLFMLFQSVLGFLAPPMAVVFLIGVLWKKATPIAANLVLSLGSVISIGIGICSLLKIGGEDFWPHPLLLSFFIFVGLIVMIVLVSLVTMTEYAGSPLPKLKETILKNGGNKMIWVLWAILSVVMIALYIFFN